MSVEISPSELGFRRPFTNEVYENLRIKNPGPRPIAFKVKTTAPRQYCVRPNFGRVEAGDEVEVQVLLQAMRQDPPPDTKCKDKFLVQSITIEPDQEFSNTPSVWQNAERDGTAIHEKKIRVSWLPESGAGLLASTPNRAANTREVVDTPPNHVTGTSFSSPQHEASQLPPPTANSSMVSNDHSVSHEGGIVGTAAAAVSTGAAAVAAKSQATYEELQAHLREAEKSIARLSDEGVRQRKVAGGDASTGTSQSAPVATAVQSVVPNNGVPLNIVALIALMAFLLAYFFF